MLTGELCERLKLFSALFAHEENLKPSHKRGKRVIDHIVLGDISAEAIIQSGQLPHRVGFANADHRGVYLDLDSRPGLDTIVEELATRKARKLVLKNSKHVNTYVKEVLTRFKEQNIYDRVIDLWEQTKGGNINTEQKAQYNTLDRIITEIMVKAESLLPSKRRNG